MNLDVKEGIEVLGATFTLGGLVAWIKHRLKKVEQIDDHESRIKSLEDRNCKTSSSCALQMEALEEKVDFQFKQGDRQFLELSQHIEINRKESRDNHKEVMAAILDIARGK